MMKQFSIHDCAGQSGPSAGIGLEHTMLPKMLDHIIQTFFPGIWRAPTGNLREVTSHKLHLRLTSLQIPNSTARTLAASLSCSTAEFAAVDIPHTLSVLSALLGVSLLHTWMNL